MTTLTAEICVLKPLDVRACTIIGLADDGDIHVLSPDGTYSSGALNEEVQRMVGGGSDFLSLGTWRLANPHKTLRNLRASILMRPSASPLQLLTALGVDKPETAPNYYGNRTLRSSPVAYSRSCPTVL